MNLLITYAVEPEFAPWRKLATFEKVPSGKFPIQRAKIGSSTADFLVTGMGPGYARCAIDSVQGIAYDACICAGFAGALRPEYQVGDILVPEHVVEAGTAATNACDPALLELATNAKRSQALLSSPKIIASAAEKAALAASAAAVDMESFTVTSIARNRGIPAIAIRVISDTSEQEMPVDFSKGLDENGQVSTGAVLKLLVGQPGKIGALMALGRQSKQAADALADFLSGYLQALPENLRAKSTALANG